MKSLRDLSIRAKLLSGVGAEHLLAGDGVPPKQSSTVNGEIAMVVGKIASGAGPEDRLLSHSWDPRASSAGCL